MHHYYYGDPKTLDLGKMREECTRRAMGDMYAKPASSIIHHHKAGEECGSQYHEDFPAQEETV